MYLLKELTKNKNDLRIQLKRNQKTNTIKVSFLRCNSSIPFLIPIYLTENSAKLLMEALQEFLKEMPEQKIGQ